MGKVILRGTARLENPQGCKIDCKAKDKSFILDEPERLGGSDLGMNPIEAMLCSLGACKCIIARSGAKKMGLKLDEISVECSGVLDPDGVNGKNADAKVGLSRIDSVYTIKSPESTEDLEKLIAYVDKYCPVQDTLLNPAEFNCKLKRVE